VFEPTKVGVPVRYAVPNVAFNERSLRRSGEYRVEIAEYVPNKLSALNM
jgi:hypothetical protein